MPLFGFTNVAGSVITQTSVAIAQGTDADAQAFIDAASITDSTQISAVNQLVLDLKGYGVWDKCKAIYPILGGSASSHAVNLKTPGTYNLTFATGMTHSSTGMVSNGTTGYADTNILPTSVLSLNSVHLTFYSRTNSTGNYAEIGASGTGLTNTTYLQIDSKWSDNNFYGNANDADFTTNTVADSLGFLSVSRTGASASKTYKNGSVVTTKNVSSVALPDRNIFICARNLANGGTSNYSNRQCAFASIGDGLTDSEAADFYTAVQAYQTTLSRNV